MLVINVGSQNWDTEDKANLLVTGQPVSGKTTVIENIILRLAGLSDIKMVGIGSGISHMREYFDELVTGPGAVKQALAYPKRDIEKFIFIDGLEQWLNWQAIMERIESIILDNGRHNTHLITSIEYANGKIAYFQKAMAHVKMTREKKGAGWFYADFRHEPEFVQFQPIRSNGLKNIVSFKEVLGV
jgi:hypothetical protein